MRYPYAFLVALCCGAFLFGCSQTTSAPVTQPARQVQTPVTDQAAQGAKIDIRNYFVNAPAGEDMVPKEGGLTLLQGQYATSRPSVGEVVSNGVGSSIRDTRAGYSQSGFTLNMTIYGSSTGAQTGGGASGQTIQPAATITQSPEQKPQTQFTVPVAVGMPGSAPQASAASSWEGPASLTPSQQAELQTLINKAAGGDPKAGCDLANLVAQFFGKKVTPAEAPQ